MGAILAKLFGNAEVRLLMLGLDAAGKTNILDKLNLNKPISTTVTAGFNVECIKYKDFKFNVWDVGGKDSVRSLWKHYYTGTRGLVFVVDSNDRARIDEARQELRLILNDPEMKDCLLLVFANKQDMKGAMTTAEVTEKLGLNQLQSRIWYVQPSIATTKEGLLEGIQWLSDRIRETQ